MNLTSYVQDKHLTIALTGEIDHHCARTLIQEIGTKLETYLPMQCCMDFQAVTFMDSSGIAVVLNTARRMKELGGSLQLQNLPPQVRRVLNAANIEKITKIV
jgi:stage II sporulation protein AA (anti-sigma F factor antagonist)